MNERALAAEFIGTFTLVTALCGTALFQAPIGGGPLAVAAAAGVSVLAMCYAVGHVSGGHFNPAVTLGLVAGGRFNAADAPGYIAAQLLGAVAAAFVFQIILGGAPTGANAAKLNSFMAISNTFGPGKYSLAAAFIIEAVATALFLIVVMGATAKRAPADLAPIAIGLAFGLFYLITIPVSNASLNPARSTATAVLAGGQALFDLWVFWVAPIVGAVIGGTASRWLHNE
jgi:aquaporin Z